jgi:hypothetical protein
MAEAGMRDDCALDMSPPDKDTQPTGRRRTGKQTLPGGATEEPGVLSSLPSTRPQRPSARRAATRQSAAAHAERAAAKPKRKTPPARTAKPRPKPPKPAEPPVPRQGFEAEEAIEAGRSVQPPSGAELAASIVELVGELAQTGLSASGRVLRDALKRPAGG